MTLFSVMVVTSGLLFLAYGARCVFSEAMVDEFRRFGLSPFRVLTGWLEILGGIGLLVGLWMLPLLWFSASGLAVLMLLGVGVRFRVRDGAWLTLPALLLLLLNAWLALEAWRRLS